MIFFLPKICFSALGNLSCDSKILGKNRTENFAIIQMYIFFVKIYGRLSRSWTSGGSKTGLSLVDPTNFYARKFFLFTEGFLKVKNKEHLVDFVVTLYSTSLCFNALSSGTV